MLGGLSGYSQDSTRFDIWVKSELITSRCVGDQFLSVTLTWDCDIRRLLD